jgi:hypothetical protein
VRSSTVETSVGGGKEVRPRAAGEAGGWWRGRE